MIAFSENNVNRFAVVRAQSRNKPPLHERKDPPHKRKAPLLTTFWRRFCEQRVRRNTDKNVKISWLVCAIEAIKNVCCFCEQIFFLRARNAAIMIKNSYLHKPLDKAVFAFI